MKNTYINAKDHAEARNVWHLTEYQLNFTDKERYKKAVRILMNSKKHRLLCNGRYLYGNQYGYVIFKRISA